MRFGPGADSALRAALPTPEHLLEAPGVVVRSTPRRWTLSIALGGRRWFVKHRMASAGDTTSGREALGEWEAIESLAGIGVRVPATVCLAEDGLHTALGCLPAPGRPMSVLWAEAVLAGKARRRVPSIVPVAEAVARIHRQGWVYRDLYWQHLFGERLGDEPTFIDAERLARAGPLWLGARARGRDLAGLVSSLPPGVDRRAVLEVLADRAGGSLPRADWIVAKSERIAARQPRFG